MSESCDVLIVGGGPAGSSCARQLRRAGLDVLILDKSEFPRDKVCAGWITPQVVEELEIDTRDYTKLGSSVALFHTTYDDDLAVRAETGVDASWHRPMAELLRRAMDDGYGDKSVTALVELLRVAPADELTRPAP